MSEATQSKLLEIYLDDHWAGAAAGKTLARRMFRSNADTRWSRELAWLVEQIESDEQTLLRLRRLLQLEGGKGKRVLALVAERLGRLKPNGRIVGYSPLSRLLEAEAMMAGILAKQRLWAALRHGGPHQVDSSAFDFAELERRANEQLETLASFHRDAAALVFGTAADVGS